MLNSQTSKLITPQGEVSPFPIGSHVRAIKEDKYCGITIGNIYLVIPQYDYDGTNEDKFWTYVITDSGEPNGIQPKFFEAADISPMAPPPMDLEEIELADKIYQELTT